jgi:hypothetical protein
MIPFSVLLLHPGEQQQGISRVIRTPKAGRQYDIPDVVLAGPKTTPM